jgi:hypothetical protein
MEVDMRNPGEDFSGAVLRVPVLDIGRGSHKAGEKTGTTLEAGLKIGLLRILMRACSSQEGARIQDRRTMMIVTRRDHVVFDVIIAGCTEILQAVVHEGKEEI